MTAPTFADDKKSRGPVEAPTLNICDRDTFAPRTVGFLETSRFSQITTVLSRVDADAFLRRVNVLFGDLDGTFLPSSTKALTPEVVQDVHALDKLGVKFYFLTGKPRSEVDRIARSLPDDFPGQFVFEKGAFIASIKGGDVRYSPFLVTQEVSDAIVAAKALFHSTWQRELSKKYSPRNPAEGGVQLELCGDGTHSAIFGVDVLRGDRPDDFLHEKYLDRSEIKVKDQALIGEIYQELLTLLQNSGIELFKVTSGKDLGQANFEFIPGALKDLGAIDKDAAIQRLSACNDFVLGLGDSSNDTPMFRQLASRPVGQAYSGLVYHGKSPEECANKLKLLNHVQFGMVGEANAHVLIRYLRNLRCTG